MDFFHASVHSARVNGDAKTARVAAPDPAPAPAHDDVADATAGPDAAGRGRSRAAAVAAWGGDLLAIALVTLVLVWLESHDGGLEPYAMARVGIVALLAVPLAVREASILPRGVQTLLAAWGVGGLLSILLAVERSRFVEPAMVLGFVPIFGLVVRRLWRRPWGPPLLVAIALVGFGRYWYRSFLQWWGDILQGDSAQWLSLSWHNQSGTLMGALGLLFAGVALAGRRVLAVVAAIVAAAGLTGVWLSGSRGALVALAVGLAVCVVAAIRARADALARALAGVGARLAGIVAMAAAIVLGLSSIGTGTVVAPVTSRATEESTNEAGDNFRLRLYHMEAAARMAADRPLTGQGLGSYRTMARAFNSPNGNLTASAHNEYLENAAEGGLALTVPFIGLHLVALALVVRRVRRPDGDDAPRGAGPDELRVPLAIGAVGAVMVLALHAGADFDWGYPVLPALLAFAVATAASTGVTPRWRIAGLVVVPTAVLLAIGVAGVFVERGASSARRDLDAQALARAVPPWDSERARDIAVLLSANGEFALAESTALRALRWSPGDQANHTTLALVRYRAGEIAAGDLVATLRYPDSPFPTYNVVAGALLTGGETDLALEVLTTVEGYYATHTAWGIEDTAADTRLLRIEHAGLTGGCEAARTAADDAIADPLISSRLRGADEAFAERAEAHCGAS